MQTHVTLHVMQVLRTVDGGARAQDHSIGAEEHRIMGAEEHRKYIKGSTTKAVQQRQYNKGSTSKAVQQRQYNKGSTNLSYVPAAVPPASLRRWLTCGLLLSLIHISEPTRPRLI
eukprot:2590435-Rhodomonas_salina.2